MEINEKDLAKIIEIMEAKNLLITDTFGILEKTPKIIDENDEIELAVDYQNKLRIILSNSCFEHRDIGFDEKNCPTPKELVGKRVKVLSKLFYFDGSFTKESAEKKMEEAGFRQSNIRELLSLSGLNIKPRKKSVEVKILAFGSTKNVYFPVISYDHLGNRYLKRTNFIEYTIGFRSMYVLGIKK